MSLSYKLPLTAIRNGQVFEGSDAAQVPFTVRGATGQTAPHFNVEAQDGTDYFTIGPTGNITISQDLAVSGSTNITIDQAVAGNLTLTGNLAVNGNSILGNAATDTLTVYAVSTFRNNLTVWNDLQVNNDISVVSSIHLQERSGNPNSLSNNGSVYTRDVSGVTELYYLDSSGNAVQITDNGSINGGSIFWGDDENISFGNTSASPDFTIDWETADADAHYVNFAVSSVSRNIIISEDRNIDWTHAAQTNPTLWIQSADSATVADYISLAHNQTDAMISVGAGDLLLSIAGANLAPSANDGAALGISGQAFSDLFLASGAIVNFAAGNVTWTHSANALNLTANSVNLVDFTSTGVIFNNGNADVDFTFEAAVGLRLFVLDAGTFSGQGSAAIGGTAVASNIVFTVDVAAVTTATDNFAKLMVGDNGIVTTNAGVTNIYNLWVQEINITVGTGTPTTTTSLYIQDSATEGTNNYALWVDNGKVKLDGGGTSRQVTAEGGVLAVPASTVNGNNASSTIAIGTPVNIGITTYTNDNASLTMTNSASLYIAGIPVASTNVIFTNAAYALWVDAGTSAFGGTIVPDADDGSAIGTAGLRWSDLFLASGSVINFAGGDVTITHSANALAFAGALSNYTFDDEVTPSGNDAAALGNGGNSWADLFLASGGVINWANGNYTITHSASSLTLAMSAATSGSPTALTITGAAHTTLAASTEAVDVNFNFARVVQFAQGAMATQRTYRWQAQTYATATGASTFTTVIGHEVEIPIAGTNATFTNEYGIRISSASAHTLTGSLYAQYTDLSTNFTLGGAAGSRDVWGYYLRMPGGSVSSGADLAGFEVNSNTSAGYHSSESQFKASGSAWSLESYAFHSATTFVGGNAGSFLSIPTQGSTGSTNFYHFNATNIAGTVFPTNQYGLYINSLTSATNNFGVYMLPQGIATGIGAVTTTAGLYFAAGSVSLGNQTATVTNLNAVRIEQGTYTSTTLVRTVTNPVSLYIAGAPIASTNVSFTNAALAVWVDTGNVRIDDSLTDGTVTFALNTIYRSGGTDVALADGGTNASLTASNGGIFYSTATAGAILAGTATAGQLLQSGATAAPTWSTTTYPATNAINTLLYASSANVMAALATANGGILNTGATGIPSITATPLLGVAGTTAGTLRLSGLTSGVVTIDVVAAAGTWAFTLPTGGGAANYAMITDGSGNASWSVLPVAGGGTGATASTGSGSVVLATSPALTTPNIGAATGTSVVLTGAITSSSSSGIGYATGAGGAVTQQTNRTTGVSLSTICGQITTNNASLAAESSATFNVGSSPITATDTVIISHTSSNSGNTNVYVSGVMAGSFNITVANNNASGGAAETGAIIINFSIIKAVAA